VRNPYDELSIITSRNFKLQINDLHEKKKKKKRKKKIICTAAIIKRPEEKSKALK